MLGQCCVSQSPLGLLYSPAVRLWSFHEANPGYSRAVVPHCVNSDADDAAPQGIHKLSAESPSARGRPERLAKDIERERDSDAILEVLLVKYSSMQ